MRTKLMLGATGAMVAVGLTGGPALANGTPNQGEESKVLSVDNTAVSCSHPTALSKVEGGLGTRITFDASYAIDAVTVKSGVDAKVLAKEFSKSGSRYTGTITLSKAVSNYVIWVCQSGADENVGTQDDEKGSGATGSTSTADHGTSEGSHREAGKVVMVTNTEEARGKAVAQAAIKGDFGTTVSVHSDSPIQKVSLTAGAHAKVIEKTFWKSGSTYWAKITLTKPISSYVLWVRESAETKGTTNGEDHANASTNLVVANAEVAGGALVALPEVKGEFGKTITVKSSYPIGRVSLTAGAHAKVLEKTFWKSGSTYWAKITLTKPISGYVLWVNESAGTTAGAGTAVTGSGAASAGAGTTVTGSGAASAGAGTTVTGSGAATGTTAVSAGTSGYLVPGVGAPHTGGSGDNGSGNGLAGSLLGSSLLLGGAALAGRKMIGRRRTNSY